MKIRNNWLHRLKNNSFIKTVFALSSGALIGQILSLLSTLVISRLYDKEMYGVFASISSLAAIFSSLATIGLNSSLMACDSEDECKDTFMVTMFVSLGINIILFIFLLGDFMFLRTSMAKGDINPYISCFIIFLISFFTNLTSLLIVYANKLKKNKNLFLKSIITASASLFVTIPLGYLNFGSYGFALSALISLLVNVIQMSIAIKPYKKIKFSTFGEVLRSKKKYVLFQFPSNILDTNSRQLPNQILLAGFGYDSLGGYNMTERILGIPSMLLGGPIGEVYFRTASEYQKSNKDIAPFTFKMICTLFALSLIPVALTIFWGEEIFSFVLGDEWGVAGQMAGILIAYYVFQFCTTCLSYLRVAVGKQKTNLVMSFFNLLSSIIPLVVGIYLFDDLFYTVAFFSLFKSLFLLFDMIINMRCFKGKYWLYYLIVSVAYLLIVGGFLFIKLII